MSHACGFPLCFGAWGGSLTDRPSLSRTDLCSLGAHGSAGPCFPPSSLLTRTLGRLFWKAAESQSQGRAEHGAGPERPRAGCRFLLVIGPRSASATRGLAGWAQRRVVQRRAHASVLLLQDVGLLEYQHHPRDYTTHLSPGSILQSQRRRPSLLSEFQPGNER